METWHIHIEGQVQGVGFRPYIYLLAKKNKLNGWVNNSTDGVHIEINADKNTASLFYENIKKQAPILSKITNSHIFKTKKKFFEKFQIVHSGASGEANLLLTPDFAICPDCREELHGSPFEAGGDRRADYPFITCTNCGPRYSIVRQLPYDRENTAMDVFYMCNKCREEYENPADRRYYSQTNSCPECKIDLSLHGQNTDNTHIIEKIVGYWEAGKIVAIKGIGGYLLTCDAANIYAVKKLRDRKHRPSKPFALMYPNVVAIKKDLVWRKEEVELLESPVAPIVLLNKKSENNLASDIAPKLNQIGVMLPYAPLFELLLNKFKKPIVATSGNISNSPIVFENKKAINELSNIADCILTNNREIVVPQDDSVFKLSFFKKQKIIVRRSRGLAPTYINPELKLPNKTMFATGAMLKGTFSFLHRGNVYISQYLGDLEHFDAQENYRHTARHFFDLFKTKPEIIISDKHPEYASTKYGEKLSEELNVPIEKTQHHIAHFGAILGEHNLLHSGEPILGIIWDGTGLGDDGQIWGGEFFKYENHDFLRCYYFDYFDFILGNKMPKEPRISALSACWDVMGAEDILKNKFTKTEWQVYSKLLQKENKLQTSSVGRIFDAVASLLGILDKQTYEGEAAMQLEALATKYFKTNGLSFSESYFMEGAHYYRIPTKTLMSNIVLDLKKGKAKDFIAAKFHFSLVKIIKIVANNLGIKKLAFSGGVFQNGLLVELIVHYLNDDFELFFHKELSPNDENISFGQLVCHKIKEA